MMRLVYAGAVTPQVGTPEEPSCTVSYLDARERSSELGLSMIEVMVAVLVLAVVLVPLMHFIVDTLTVTNGARLEEEASNLAASRIETVEQEATESPLSLGTTTSSTTLGADTFTVETSVQAINGTGQTLCTGADGPNQLAVWRVKTTVSWTDMAGAPPVVESTEIAPGPNAPSRLDVAEVALPLVGSDGTTFEQPVNYQVNVTAMGGPVPALPADATGSFDDGCIALEDLPAAPADVTYYYTISLTPNAGLVGTNEQSDSYVGGPPTTTPAFTLHTGQLLLLQAIGVAEGVQASVALKIETFAGGASSVAAAPDIPVTVTPGGQNYTFGNGTADVTSMLLYPYGSYSAWAGDVPESAPRAEASGAPLYPDASETEDSDRRARRQDERDPARLPADGAALERRRAPRSDAHRHRGRRPQPLVYVEPYGRIRDQRDGSPARAVQSSPRAEEPSRRRPTRGSPRPECGRARR